MSYQAYPEYKESGSKWLGEIPALWSAAPAKSLFALRSEKSNREDEHLTPSQKYGVLPQSQYMKITGNKVVLNLVGSDSMKHVEPDDFVIHLRSFQGGIEHSPVRGKVSNAYTVLIPNGSVYPQFFRWALKSDGYIQELRTTTDQLRDGQSIKFPHFGMVRLPSVPLAEQKQIADFLDRETKQIDNLIAEQQGLVENLTERRKAVIDAAFRARIGEGNRLKWSVYEVDERAGESWEKLPLLAVSISWGVRPRHEITDDAPKSLDLSNYKIARAGDLVLNRMRAFQGALGVAPIDGLVSPDYAVLQTAGSVNTTWLAALMKSQTFVDEMTKRIRGIGSTDSGAVRTPRINVADLCEILVDLPVPQEQTRRLNALEKRTVLIDELVGEAKVLIDLLKERRSALISAVVRGKIDVRSDLLSHG